MSIPSVLRCALLCGTAALSIAIPAAAQSNGSVARLQALVNDAAAQFLLAYRHDPAERERRFDELTLAIVRWNQSAHTEADNTALADWLREAMRSSMPGSVEALQPAPKFQPAAAVVVAPAGAPAAAALAEGAAATSQSGAAAPPDDRADDPFRDDPETDKR
jgi:hypothetical protein